MLPREGTETLETFSETSCNHFVNNPCYLERGRKPEAVIGYDVRDQLITHVTSRGDGNAVFHFPTSS